jgi:HAD superfamily hydrolase (TIGR01509 family)
MAAGAVRLFGRRQGGRAIDYDDKAVRSPEIGAQVAADGAPGPVAGKKSFDLVVFDCDGVVIDSEALSCAVLRRHLDRHGVPVGLNDIFERYLGHSFAVVAEDYRRILHRPIPDDFLAEMNADLFETFGHELRPIPEIESVLTGLKIPFCLTSSSGLERIRVSLRITGLAPYFGDRIFNAEMVARGKPAPDLFLLAAERMGAAASRSLVIEDSVTGVQAGKAAGMTVWGFTGGAHYAGRDGVAVLGAAGADRVFARMADLGVAGRGH